MFFNCFSRPAPKVYRLDLVWPVLTRSFKGIGQFCMVLGTINLIGMVIALFVALPPAVKMFIDPNFFNGLALVFSGRIMDMMSGMAGQFQVSYFFDGTQRQIRCESQAKRISPKLKEALPFSEVRTFRITRLVKAGQPTRWRFEIVSHADEFFPITWFNDEKKAREIIRELQLVVGAPLEEAYMDTQTTNEFATLLGINTSEKSSPS